MKNLFNSKTQMEISNRIHLLNTDSKRHWGKMNVNEMVCHCADQLRIALGEIVTRQSGNIFSKTVAKQLVLLGIPAPKGKIKTFPEIDLSLGKGTKPTNFENDKIELLKVIEIFISKSDDYNWAVHSEFGNLTKNQWGRLAYIHLNHHLKQFGV